MHDEASLDSIIETAQIERTDTVLEIGPGLGTLTEKLTARSAKVIAVEFDPILAEELPKNVNADNLTIVSQDILKFDLTGLEPDYKVVANIPYYLTSNLIRVLSESDNPPLSVTLLIQKEVAERLAAKPGSMSTLSVTAQMYFEPSLGAVIPARLFTPPPKIDSQVIHLKRREAPLFGSMDPKKLFRVVKSGFVNRRKTLLNSLSGGLQMSKEDTRLLLEASDIKPGARPQELTLQDWIKLSKQV